MYQPVVVQKMEEIINYLIESKFFEENEIGDLEFSKNYLLDALTQKFIDGNLDGEIFTEEEFITCLKEMVAGSVLNELKKKGYVETYDDEEKGELYFLTQKGKDYIKDNPFDDPITFLD
jgi:hypothetical protein